MKFKSLEHYRIDPLRFLLLLLLLSLLGGAVVSLVTKDILGSDSWVIGVITAGAAGYLVASEPRRKLDTVSLWQAREAPVVAASAAVSLRATGSNSRALMLLRCDEEELAGTLEDAKRMVLLGHAPKETIVESAAEIASESVSEALLSMVSRDAASIEDVGDELESVFAASSLGDETKVPVFIAVSFFAPIMLLLFAVLTRSTTPQELGEIVVLELIILNIAFAFSSRERRRLRT